MDNLKYNNIILESINKGEVKSKYYKTVGRQLTVFHSHEKIKEYFESKCRRIFLDYECKTAIIWNKTKKGMVKINKNEEISFPSLYIDKDKQSNFLTAIPYALALFYHKQSEKQDLYNVSFDYWLELFTFKFFGIHINDSECEELESTHFSNDIIQNYYFQNVDKTKVKSFSGNGVKSYFFEFEPYHLFYLNFDKRHLLFRFKQ